jgi:hypothetical protein
MGECHPPVDGKVLMGLHHPVRPADRELLDPLRRAQPEMQIGVVPGQVGPALIDPLVLAA